MISLETRFMRSEVEPSYRDSFAQAFQLFTSPTCVQLLRERLLEKKRQAYATRLIGSSNIYWILHIAVEEICKLFLHVKY